jgi:hypothetical protein
MTPDTISATPLIGRNHFGFKSACFSPPPPDLSTRSDAWEFSSPFYDRLAQFTCGALWIKWHAGSVFSPSRAS